MNFLAHLYLSEDNPKIIIGNFIADHIKGNRFTHLDTQIQKGIRLHREIDTFTDAHRITRISKGRLGKRHGLYAGIIVDIFYDHYLAKNWHDYSAIPLDIYVEAVYQLLEDHKQILPKKTLEILPAMVRDNWLYNYRYKEGIKNVLIGMNDRTENKGKIDTAIKVLHQFDSDFENDFKLFFEELKNFSSEKIKQIKSQNPYP